MSVHRVVYKGLSDIREMSVKDLKVAGVHAERDLMWDKTTHGRRPAVLIADISDRLLEIFREEGTFTVTEIDEETMQENGEDPIMVGESLDDTGSIVRDSTTGQQSSKGDSDANADPLVSSAGAAGASGSAEGSSVSGATGKSGKGSKTRKGSST